MSIDYYNNQIKKTLDDIQKTHEREFVFSVEDIGSLCIKYHDLYEKTLRLSKLNRLIKSTNFKPEHMYFRSKQIKCPICETINYPRWIFDESGESHDMEIEKCISCGYKLS